VSGAGTSSEAAWEAALDGVERDVAALERRLAEGDWTSAVPGWAPPHGLGPLPPALRERAAALLDRAAAAERRLAALLAGSRDELAEVAARRDAAAAYTRD
jgi:hypothetical protein